jgi:hypothetical protein
MTRTDLLHRLARRLAHAATAGDWETLVRVDTEVAGSLACIDGPWTPAERVALDELRAAHEEALRRCFEEASRLENCLSELNRNREGWMAYALGDGTGQELQ